MIFKVSMAHPAAVEKKVVAPDGLSELRQDVVSGDWVVIATGRAKRPHEFLSAHREAFVQPEDACPFDNLHEDALLVYPAPAERENNQWWVKVIPNKYPAFSAGACPAFEERGPYQWTEGIGFHEVVVTRDHERSFARMSVGEVDRVLAAYQERYRAMANDECVAYVSIFHNHGRLAGATISHPHSQIIAIPVIPPDVGRSIKGSEEYARRHDSCIHCALVAYELEARERIVYENDDCAVLAPFASKTAFELRVFPKRHSARYEQIAGEERRGLADAIRSALAKLHRGLENPDYNMFLHTAPVRPAKNFMADNFDHYHWHFEILPKTSIWAGFEIGTGMEISAIAPENAAEFLRSITL